MDLNKLDPVAQRRKYRKEWWESLWQKICQENILAKKYNITNDQLIMVSIFWNKSLVYRVLNLCIDLGY